MDSHSTVEQLDLDVQITETNNVSSSTRTCYRSGISKFLEWYSQQEDHASLSKEFIAYCTERGFVLGDKTSEKRPTRWAISQFLKDVPDLSNPPVVFDENLGRDFLRFIQATRAEKEKSYSTYTGYRSALSNLFTKYHALMPAIMRMKIDNYFSGLQRELTLMAKEGSVPSRVGKEELPFSVYIKLCRILLESEDEGHLFVRAMLIISWNLMSRVSNTETILLEHLNWTEDHLGVIYVHSKSRQKGEKKFERSVFSNPIQPEICPILAIALFRLFVTSDPDLGPKERLFPGMNQDERYRVMLKKLLTTNERAILALNEGGLMSDDIATHSARKGSATYASSGTTAPPGVISILLRGGWSIGDTLDRYMKPGTVGDQYLGRVLCGLPPDSEKFCVLPPHFDEIDEDVAEAINLSYPFTTPRMWPIAAIFVAHLVFHNEYLRKTLPESHPIFQAPLFKSPELIARLLKKVRWGMPEDNTNDWMKPTGIPPFAAMARKFEMLQKSLLQMTSVQEESIRAMARLTRDTADAVLKGLEDMAVQANVLTKSGARELFKECVQGEFTDQLARLEKKIDQFAASKEASPQRQGGTIRVRPDTGVLVQLNEEEEQDVYQYVWGGQFHHVPKDFRIPSCTIRDGWIHFCCGDADGKIPPYRFLVSSDFSSKKRAKDWSTYMCMMNEVKSKVVEAGMWVKNPTYEQAHQMFRHAFPLLGIKHKTEKGYNRRRGQLKWNRAVMIIRQEKKKARIQQEEAAAANSDVVFPRNDRSEPAVEHEAREEAQVQEPPRKRKRT